MKKDKARAFYCSEAFAREEVRLGIYNQLVAALIQQGKLYSYFYNKNNKAFEKDCLNSDGLSYIQVEEAFKKQMLISLTWAINRLNLYVSYVSSEDGKISLQGDLLLKNIKSKDKFNKVASSVNAWDDRSKLREKMSGSLPIRKEDDVPYLIEALLETREILHYLRISCFHFKDADFLSALRGYSNKTDKMKIFLIRSSESLQSALWEQIRSSGIIEYYPTDLLCYCFTRLHFCLDTPQFSLVPSFKKLFKKGVNLYQSAANHMELHWYVASDKCVAEDKERGFLAYKNLLQMIYYYDFLPAVKKDEALFTDFITSTKMWNQRYAVKGEKGIYRYASMPDYRGESLAAYIENLQREQMLKASRQQDGEAVNNYYIPFIQDITLRAFDAYLDSYLGGNRESLQQPIQQECLTEEGMTALDQAMQEAGKPLWLHSSFEAKEIISKPLCVLYTLLSLLDTEELNRLRHHADLVHTKPQRCNKKFYYLDKVAGEKVQEYEQILKTVSEYNVLRKKLTFESLYELYRVHVDVMGRFVGFAVEWERDMYFLLLGLWQNDFIEDKYDKLNSIFAKGRVRGQMIEKLSTESKRLLYQLCWHIDADHEEIQFKEADVRNRIAHLDHLKQMDELSPSLEETLNELRTLLAYDRKRQNAVTKSVKELLAKKYHLDISWKRGSAEKSGSLFIYRIQSKEIVHLKNLVIPDRGKVDRKHVKQTSWLKRGIPVKANGDDFVKLVEKLFLFCYIENDGANHKHT